MKTTLLYILIPAIWIIGALLWARTFNQIPRAGDLRQTQPPFTSAHQTGIPALTESPRTDEWFIMNVSAYDTCDLCCAPYNDGITASGKPAVGRICAAPPEYPFGTVFEVEGHGEWVVEDRGGAIVGDKLDLLMDSHGKAILFGRHDLLVRILK